ncbi:peptide chain release factor N(5)-glutamine methyltransferase [Sneathiella sp. P13V-1]|uniref:peptide chain release factor N(5)-glutamine methyltransferase n=1 Tax=Sneathiella sp. P13V-1 TaxID=2697366 RepID=UPI00187B1175|nr:peptide chain release factor N(5)-glutamine methyltransferase [Sneathiella sp. P13V-1]MBE7636572.1 peptide chain release factor N(5)-glutamine methyltransferase [Sneathiella sp. P13V-1]
MTIRLDQALIEATIRLKGAGVEFARQDANLLMMDCLKADRDLLFREPERLLTDQEQSVFEELVERREKREPISHILGKREFWSREFIVNSHVLDPRPDTETLIELALTEMPDMEKPYRVLDLGTGSGCILLTLLAERPKATGVGVDISLDAMKVASANAENLNLENRTSFIEGPWFANVDGKFDLIVSNPPYIPDAVKGELQPEVREFEPHLALFGGEDGLDCYRHIISNAQSYLCGGGWLGFEVGIHQAQDVQKLMQIEGFRDISCANDLAGIARCVFGRI